MIRAIVLTLLFSYTYCSHAQYQVKHFTTENGLPSNGIKGLQWDSATGFLWIATEAGVVRYNGMSFKTFDVISNPEFGSNRIVAIVKNIGGRILVSGEEGNLSSIHENNISLYFKGSDSAKYDYSHYSALPASDILLRRCFKTTWNPVFDHKDILPLSDTACIGLWAGQLYYCSVSANQPVLIKAAHTDIKSVFKIGSRLYCIDVTNRLFLFDVYKSVFSEKYITDKEGHGLALHEKNSNLFWQGGMENPVLIQDEKAWVMEERNNEVRCSLIANNIPANTFFNYAQYKREGNYLFLGSASKGIYIIHQNQLTSKQPDIKNVNQRNSFYSQIELPDGNILTNEGTIIGDNPIHNNFSIGSTFVNSVFAINDTSLIYAIKDTLFMYDTKAHTTQKISNTRINDGFAVAFSGKRLYFANQRGIGIVNSNDSISFLKRYDEKGGIRMQAFTMLEISPGKLAIATCNGLLGFDTKTNKIDTLFKIPAVCIRTLYKEGDYIFIGTYGGGYFVMKDGIIKAMPLDINQYLKYAHCFVKDKNDFLWISTNNGLFKVKLADIIEAYEKNPSQIYYHYLGKEDGMETTEMNGGCTPCALKLQNGNFSFPTMDGLLWLNPKTTSIALPAGNIYIDRFLANGADQTITGSAIIQLPVNSNKLDISLAINAWCKKENLYLDYRLNDENWLPVQMTSGEPTITFSNLGHGNYTLQIRKMNGFGANNYSYSNIAFTIATPFYHQWWFRILAILILIGVGYMIFKIRLRQYAARQEKLERLVEEKTMDLNLKNLQLEKNDRIKTRLISVINHDIITPLKFMHYSGKALMDNKENIEPAQQEETIADITQTAKDMEQLSSQILNWIIYQNPNRQMHKEEFDLHQLAEVVLRVLQFQAKQKNTNLQNSVPPNFVVCQYLEPMRVMIYNLVMNSLSFTKNGTITVSCVQQKNQIIIDVSDTGLGMTQSQIDNILSDERIIPSVNVDNKKGTGLGYVIIKDLLHIMEGSLSIKSIKNEGTQIFVSIPG